MVLHVPTVTEDDLRAFHSKHLATCPLPGTFFSAYREAEVYDGSYNDEDGLGYYANGVKRTLTDEQIAMFRHSEIQALLTERRHRREADEDSDNVQMPEETMFDVVLAAQQTAVASKKVTLEEEITISDIPAEMATGDDATSPSNKEAEIPMLEKVGIVMSGPRLSEPSIYTMSTNAESPAISSTRTPSSNHIDSDGEIPSDSDSRPKKVRSNRNKQSNRKLKLKRQLKQQEKLQAQKQLAAQEPEDFTPRRIAREQDELVHANVELDYD